MRCSVGGADAAQALARRQPHLVVLDRLKVLQEQGRREVHLVGLQAPLHHPVDHQRQETDQRMGPNAIGQAVIDRGNLNLAFEYSEAALDIGQALVARDHGARSGRMVIIPFL